MAILSNRLAAAVGAATLALGGCYVVPVASDGMPVGGALLAAPAPVVLSQSALPALLHARLYPLNDIAVHTGVLTGTVASYTNGRGRFQLDVAGETMIGEATRVQNDAQRGVANAFGTRGTTMNCDYRMRTPVQGVGECALSNGARYSVHLGS